MKTYRELLYTHEGNLVHKYDHYCEIYDEVFELKRLKTAIESKPLDMLEIGISHGGSLELWKKYFGPNLNLYAVDINPECAKFVDHQTKIMIGDQADPEFLKYLMSCSPLFDIIVDDGGHTMKQQLTSFKYLYNWLKPGGTYMVEDVHTSYWQQYGGGLKKKGTFIENCKMLIDALNSDHFNLTLNALRHYYSLHFYDSIVVIKKGYRPKSFSVQRGKETIAPFQEPGLKSPSFLSRLKHFLTH